GPQGGVLGKDGNRNGSFRDPLRDVPLLVLARSAYSSFIHCMTSWDLCPVHLSEMPTIRPSGFRDHGRFSFLIRPDLPEADFGPTPISCRVHANSRPDPNGPFSRNYLRHGDFTTPISESLSRASSQRSGWRTSRELLSVGSTRRQSFGLLPEFSLLHRQLVSNVILVDVGNVSDRLLANVLGRDQFNIVEPHVGIKARIGCLFAQPGDTIWSGVIAGKDKKGLIQLIDLGVIEVPVINVAQHLDSSMDVSVSRAHVRNVNGRRRRIFGDYLHDAHCAARILFALVQQRFLIALRRNHQVIEAVLPRVLLEKVEV